MATARNFTSIFRRFSLAKQQIAANGITQKNCKLCLFGAGATGTVIAFYVVGKYKQSLFNSHVLAKDHTEATPHIRTPIHSSRELRFLSFASMEYEGQVYMTPQDFLESIMEEAPRPRTGRSRLRKDDVERLLKGTPHRGRGSTTMFRTLHDTGMISYTEYLFLLCVLTKPRSGFRIAFNMFDTDGNQRVDKKEFRVLESMLAGHCGEETRELLESIITQSHSQKDTEDHPRQDTTLLVHFFGRRGNEVLKYEDFYRFMENLQTEVLELEFNEFARGMPTITEEEFAQILLHYTIFSKDEQHEYIERLRKRIPQSKGITFKDFKEFGQFLNNLDDFAIAMRMYTYADQPISESEFKRAVLVCTGQNLHDHLVHTVFQLFDIDGDGHLSHKEFISIMKDRLHRGFKSKIPTTDPWQMFRSCVKNEMKNA